MSPWHLLWIPSVAWLFAVLCGAAIQARRHRHRYQPRPAALPYIVPVEDDETDFLGEAEAYAALVPVNDLPCEICGRPYQIVCSPASPNPIRLCGGCVADDAGFKVPQRKDA